MYYAYKLIIMYHYINTIILYILKLWSQIIPLYSTICDHIWCGYILMIYI